VPVIRNACGTASSCWISWMRLQRAPATRPGSTRSTDPNPQTRSAGSVTAVGLDEVLVCRSGPFSVGRGRPRSSTSPAVNCWTLCLVETLLPHATQIADPMLLLLSSRMLRRIRGGEDLVDVASDVSLEAADCFSFGLMVCPGDRAGGVLESRALMMRRSSCRGDIQPSSVARCSI
jgi:hypothetical protein